MTTRSNPAPNSHTNTNRAEEQTMISAHERLLRIKQLKPSASSSTLYFLQVVLTTFDAPERVPSVDHIYFGRHVRYLTGTTPTPRHNLPTNLS